MYNKRGLVHYYVGQHSAGEKAERSISGVGSLLKATRRDSGTGLGIGNRKSNSTFLNKAASQLFLE